MAGKLRRAIILEISMEYSKASNVSPDFKSASQKVIH